ncbi:glycoside hydrolase family 88/105 protein [Adhaeribacter radiodurans]|uniref:Glycoside hydrolase family 88 protein n=1 Tax=Adhaeribacter radiodurans TaxID=2745197 RepID=A0A7L7L7Y8_9BACT|nr:glycoside hydrolase family 88 protein [Adhaeribacter radiodurans]QMU28655.1 glycoside hydrolase family 88 protein [Adhaeribacter radiodurans]
MKKFLSLLLIFASTILPAPFSYSQTPGSSWSEKMAATAVNIWQDSLVTETGKAATWSFDEGLVLEGFTNVWRRTAKGAYFKFVQTSMNRFVKPDGSIARYKSEDFELDDVKNGRILLTLYKVTLQEKYYKAATLLREQLRKQPRTKEGNFWHQNIYPYQTWLNDLYLAQPFYAEYAATFNQPEAFEDIANQFISLENHLRDTETGLLNPGWDEARTQKWIDRNTDLSLFWGRAMGLYGAGLVDVLEYFPVKHPQRTALLQILERFALAVEKVQDSKSGVWYQILDQPTSKNNYSEASASSLFVYALGKAVRLGYLPQKYEAVALKGHEGIVKEFIKTNETGQVNLEGTASVDNLGGSPYRDDSYEFLYSKKVVTNDPNGVGAFLMASNEMELRTITTVGKGKTLLLDGYFNNEFIKDASGQTIPFHYKWEEQDNNGFSLLGEHARYMRAQTAELKQAPTAQNLKNADVYLIVDPDTEKETAQPNYVQPAHVKAISEWVKNGGVLLLMGNDLPNNEFDHFNTLAKAFGIEFKKETKNLVIGNDFELGKIVVPANHSIFKNGRQLFLKDISTLNLKSPAKSVLDHKGDVVMAVAKVGKGTVFAVGDPWLYNEYTDGRKLPAEYQNFEAGTDLLTWLFQQVPATSK